MKNKLLPLMMALMLGMGAFVFPVSAYASGGADTTPPTINVNLEKDTLSITASDNLSGVEAVYVDKTRVNSLSDGKGSVLLKDYAGNEKQVSVYAVDYSGNQSETVKLDNPYYKEPKKTEPDAGKQTVSNTDTSSPAPSGGNTSGGTQESSDKKPQSGASSNQTETPAQGEETESALPEGALTPDGTGTILDSATEQEDDKQFYTIKTEAGNVFYLVIDGKRGSENVYFLNGVTESDLMALTEKGQGTPGAIPETEICNCSEKCEAGNVNTDCPVCKNKMTGCLGKSEEKPAQDNTSQQEQKEEKNSNTGMIFFVLLALAAAGGLGYYFKIVRPKQQAAMDDTDEYEDEGFGEGFEPDSEYHETLPDDTDGDETTKDGR